jgi:N-acetylmuramoyl-L-alanine amidase
MQKVLFALAFVFTIVALQYNVPRNEPTTVTLNLPRYEELTKHQKTEVDCLTQNIYREAGIEKESGMIAVGLVTMNRVKTPGFPETVCKVVKQKTKKTCQFSWTCIKKLPDVNERIYSYSRSLAIRVFFNHRIIDDPTFGALFYHADYVRPRWTKLEVTTKIGRHIFYKPIGEA